MGKSIDTRRIQRWIDDQAADGAGSATLSACRSVVGKFVKFLYASDVLISPTVIQVRLPKLAARKPRRAFTKAEFERFLSAVESDERKLIYVFASVSGLRAKEISCVTVADLRGLGTDQPCVMLSAEWTKNRKSGVQPLPPSVGGILADWISSQGLNGHNKLFQMPRRADMTDWITSDLERAGIPRIANGLRLNFHSLRKSFVTWMMADGRDLRTVQKLARHSNPALTAGVYTDESQIDSRSALASLPSFSVTPLVTPAAGVTGDLVITLDHSTDSRSTLKRTELAEDQADRESELDYVLDKPNS